MAGLVNHKIYRTKPALALITVLVALLIVIGDADGAYIRRRKSLETADRGPSQHRVRQPCDGSQATEQVLVTEQIDEDEGNKIRRVDGDVRHRILAVGDKLQTLYGLVSDFMTLYHNTRSAARIEGISVPGMPLAHEFYALGNHRREAELVVDAIEKLSRVAFLFDLLEVEDRAETPPLAFSFIDSPQHGIYTVLCHLHQLADIVVPPSTAVDDIGQRRTTPSDRTSLDRLVDEAVSRLTLPHVTRRSNRHIRAYAALYDLTQLLQHLTASFRRVYHNV